VVTRQFSEWMLTGSEIEVGWLLLKGLSLKEIAIVGGSALFQPLHLFISY